MARSKKPKLATGGIAAPIVDQIKAEGGMMDHSGEDVNGVTVPPGSLREEVADTVDAKLSEGEFVLPADVVRYIGLEKLMALRDAAKKGLSRMQEIGQVGNAQEVENPDQTFGGEEDTTQFESDIDSILSEDSAAQQTQQAFAVGGSVGRVMMGTDLTKAPKNTAIDVRYFKNAEGKAMWIVYVNGKPQGTIPQGYEEISKEDALKLATTADTKKEESKTTDETVAEKQTKSGGDPLAGYRDENGNFKGFMSDEQDKTVKAMRDVYGWDNPYDKGNISNAAKVFGAGILSGPVSAVGTALGLKKSGEADKPQEFLDWFKSTAQPAAEDTPRETNSLLKRHPYVESTPTIPIDPEARKIADILDTFNVNNGKYTYINPEEVGPQKESYNQDDTITHSPSSGLGSKTGTSTSEGSGSGYNPTGGWTPTSEGGGLGINTGDYRASDNYG